MAATRTYRILEFLEIPEKNKNKKHDNTKHQKLVSQPDHRKIQKDFVLVDNRGPMIISRILCV